MGAPKITRERLAVATTAYFEQLDPKAAREEIDLAEGLVWERRKINFDTEV
jgi:hypothetical protein